MTGKDLQFDQEGQEKPSAFSLEQAFLSTKDYMVIWALSFVMMVCKIATMTAFMLGWEPKEELAGILFVLVLPLQVIGYLIFLFIPVVIVVRIIMTKKLKKIIQELEEAVFIRDNINQLRDKLYNELSQQ